MLDTSTPVYVWIAAAIIVAIGIAFGFSDLVRFSLTRAWAIGGVSFRESIRRRVLWIIPLAVIGVIIVSQLQKAVDERDLVRETTKFCLFAAGLVLVLTSIILAATNLPKEIETRVIYTVVTKPATRLELILGKIIGFSHVAAVILIIMGLFSYGYLEARALSQESLMSSRLATDPTLGDAERNRLEHFQSTGLLTAESYVNPDEVEITGTLPGPNQSMRSMYGQGDEELMFPFKVDQAKMFADPDNPDGFSGLGGIGKTGMLIGLRMQWRQFIPESAAMVKLHLPPPEPKLTLDILGADRYLMIGSTSFFDPRYPGAKLAHTEQLPIPHDNKVGSAPMASEPIVWAYLPPHECGLLYNLPVFYIHLTGIAREIQYFADASSAFIEIAPEIPPGTYAPSVAQAEAVPADQRIASDQPLGRGRPDTRGNEELIGKKAEDANVPYAVFRFRNAGAVFNRVAAGEVPLEFRATIQHGGDIDADEDAPTDAILTVLPAGTDKQSAPVGMRLENQQTNYGVLPAASIGNGDFDVIVRCDSPGNVLCINNASLSLVSGTEPFAWNLAKSLFILWMLAVLVVTIAVLCSTFLSWPIAVVLTAVLLMGHWCVTQVADTADATLGRSIATDMGLTDPSKAEAVVTSVNALSTGLLALGKVLPDIDQFAAIDDIQRGAIVTVQTVADAGSVLLTFALPMAVLAYLIMKKKEVAP